MKLIKPLPEMEEAMARFNENYAAVSAYEKESKLPSFSRVPNFGWKKGGD